MLNILTIYNFKNNDIKLSTIQRTYIAYIALD